MQFRRPPKALAIPADFPANILRLLAEGFANNFRIKEGNRLKVPAKT
jgi:hypothetical protein